MGEGRAIMYQTMTDYLFDIEHVRYCLSTCTTWTNYKRICFMVLGLVEKYGQYAVEVDLGEDRTKAYERVKVMGALFRKPLIQKEKERRRVYLEQLKNHH